MADEAYTKADLDAAIKAATDKLQESIDRLETKNTELVGDLRKARKAGDIKPEDLTAAEDRADKAEAALAAAQKDVKTLTTERDRAVKALETESGAARSYALDAEIAAGIAEGGVIPALAGAYRALLKEQKPEVEVVDGKFITKLGGKPIREFITEDLAGENGKHFKAAAINSGGNATGGKTGEAPKTMLRSAFDALPPVEQHAFTVKDGGKVVDVAA